MTPDEHGNYIRTDADRHPDARERAEIERRERIDDNFVAINARFVELERKIDDLSEVTKQVRDVLASFRVMGAVAKWLTVIGTFAVMCWHGIQEIRK